jgi:hypothetical protein
MSKPLPSLWRWDQSVIRRPQEDQEGWWVGAPSVTYSERAGFLLAYRLRAGDGRRGFKIGVARSDDGIHFEDVWATTQDEWSTPSFERPCIRTTPDGLTLLVSYVDPATDLWRIDQIAAPSADRFHVEHAKPFLRAEPYQLGSVKDPFVWTVGNTRYAYVSCTPAFERTEAVADALQKSHDPFTVNEFPSMTGVFAVGADNHPEWQGMVLAPRPGTPDGHTARLTGILDMHPTPLVFYDANHEAGNNYEEYTELAWLRAPGVIQRLHRSEPLLTGFGTGFVRYVDAITVGSRLYCYYEQSTASGGHELAVSVLSAGGTEK